jgi:hypothetical protein
MLRRFILILTITLAPAFALADETTPTPTPVQSDGGAAAALGPQAGGNQTASSADSGVLQPAGTTPLQATTNDSSGLVAPNTDPLQAASGNNTDLRVMLGSEADGVQHQPTDTSNQTLLDSLILGVAVLAFIAILLVRRHQFAKARQIYS